MAPRIHDRSAHPAAAPTPAGKPSRRAVLKGAAAAA